MPVMSNGGHATGPVVLALEAGTSSDDEGAGDGPDVAPRNASHAVTPSATTPIAMTARVGRVEGFAGAACPPCVDAAETFVELASFGAADTGPLVAGVARSRPEIVVRAFVFPLGREEVTSFGSSLAASSNAATNAFMSGYRAPAFFASAFASTASNA